MRYEQWHPGDMEVSECVGAEMTDNKCFLKNTHKECNLHASSVHYLKNHMTLNITHIFVSYHDFLINFLLCRSISLPFLREIMQCTIIRDQNTNGEWNGYKLGCLKVHF